MLTAGQLATVRAALLYWEEEMGPHNMDIPLPAPDPPGFALLSQDELRQLRDRFGPRMIRYAVYDPHHDCLGRTELFADSDTARQQAGADGIVVTVLLPTPEDSDR